MHSIVGSVIRSNYSVHSEPRAGLLPAGVGMIAGGRGAESRATVVAYAAVRSRHTLAPPLVLVTISSSTAASAPSSAWTSPRACRAASSNSSTSRNQPAAGPLFPLRDLHSAIACSASESNSFRIESEPPCTAGRDCSSAMTRLSAHRRRLT